MVSSNNLSAIVRRETSGEQVSMIQSKMLDDIRVQADWPDVVLLLAPCRSASSMVCEAMRASGVYTLYQPIKNMIRARLVGHRLIYTIPPREKVPVLFTKETFGPYIRQECEFDPIGFYISAGVPVDRLRVALLVREPSQCMSSWNDAFGEVDSSNFVRAFQAIENSIATCRRHGINFKLFRTSMLSPAVAKRTMTAFADFAAVRFNDRMLHWPTPEITLSELTANLTFEVFEDLCTTVAAGDSGGKNSIAYIPRELREDPFGDDTNSKTGSEEIWNRLCEMGE